MKTRQLGSLWPVSLLTLGGGGVGQLWGETTREECIATVRAAVDSGITLLDMAPAYGNGEAEVVVGHAFEGKLPAGVRVTTKHRLGNPPAGDVEKNVRQSLGESLARMRLERVDLFFLHSNIIPDDYDASAYTDRPATRWTTYIEQFVPVCEKLVSEGRIGAWGITGIGIPECVLAALANSPRPAAVQAITNPLDSPGELKYFAGPSRAREIIAQAKTAGVGVLGIRPVQGGALCDVLDRALPAGHGVVTDYEKSAGFRTLARELGTSAAALAHRYALSMPGVDTVVLGCKNRQEIAECVAAANAGPLEAALMARIDCVFGAKA
ncbi:MAG: aldo/keto reductase [Proteobacteria bacterium]|nr:aldo/keto reductase [Pseudomonadota bacterium]